MTRFCLLLSTLTLCASTVHPCSCGENSVRSDFRSAKAIFVGEVLYVSKGGLPVEIKFKVEKQWKGHQQKEFTAAWDGPGPCGGFMLEQGRRYLVYVRGREMHAYTSCDRTAKLDHASDDIRRLNTFWFRFFARLIPI